MTRTFLSVILLGLFVQGCVEVEPRVGDKKTDMRASSESEQETAQHGDNNRSSSRSSNLTIQETSDGSSTVKWIVGGVVLVCMAFAMRNLSVEWGGHIEADKRRGVKGSVVMPDSDK
jgi:hypothetical protein